MKNLPSNLKNFEKELKRFLKKKISIDDGTVVKYLIAGFIGLFAVNTNAFATVLNKEDGQLKSDAYYIQIGRNASLPAVNNGIYSVGAIAIGEEAKVTSSESIAIGYKAQNNKAHNVAIGTEAKTGEQQATAIGQQAEAANIGSTALGYLAKSTGQKAIAIGSEAAASEIDSLAAGTKAAATGIYSLALGTEAAASGPYSIAFGKDTKAQKHGTVALGFTSKATEHHSTALGEAAAATAENATALGYKSKAQAKDAAAFGSDAQATGISSTATGHDSKATGSYSSALGNGAQATGDASLALGRNAVASATGGVALGSASTANVASGVVGYKPGDNYNGLTGTALTSNRAAVSVGNGSTITRQITGLAAGTSDTDAVNVAQLKSLQKSIKLNTSGNSGTGSVLLDDQTLAVTGANGITTEAKNQGIAIKLDDATKAKIDSAMSSFNIKANSETTSETISNGNTITFKEGDNIKVTRNGKDITIATSKTPTFDSVTITNGPVINGSGINMNNKKITNVANGTGNNDAVNLSQLNAARTEVKSSDNSVSVTKSETGGKYVYDLKVSSTGSGGTVPETYFHVNTGSNAGGNTTTNLGAIDKAAGATGTNAITAGVNAVAAGQRAVSIGNGANSGVKAGAIALGDQAKVVNSTNAIAIGQAASVRTNDNFSGGRGSIAIGHKATIDGSTSSTNGLGSVAIGANAIAGRLYDSNNRLNNTDPRYQTITGGLNATNTSNEQNVLYLAGVKDDTVNRFGSNDAVAIGNDARAIGDQSIAIGAQVIAGDASIALGGNDMDSVATVENRTKYKEITGYDLASNQSGSFYPTTSAMKGSVAIGQKAYSRTLMGTAIGTSAFVHENAELGTAIGAGSRVGKKNGGKSTKGGTAIAAGAVAEGDYTTAIGTGTHSLATEATAVGYRNKIENTGERSVTVGSNITVTTADSVVLGSGSDGSAAATKETTGTITASTGDTLTYGTFVGAPPTKDGNLSTGHYVSVGSKDAERQIKHVAAGKVSSDSTDAINGSQLYATNQVVGNVAGTAKKILGGNAALAADGNLTMTDIANTKKDNINDAIIAARTTVESSDGSVTVISKEENGRYKYDLKVNTVSGDKTVVAGGTNIASVTSDTKDGTTTYTVNADGAKVSQVANGSIKVTPGTKDATTNITDYVVDLTDEAKTDITKGVEAKDAVDNKGLTFTGDNNTTTDVKKLGDTVAITGDSNIVTKATTAGVGIALNKNLDLTKDGSLKVGDTTINNGGITTPKVTITNPPTEGTDATNKTYVDSTKTQVKSDDNTVKVTKSTSGNADVYDLSVDGSKVNLSYKANGENAQSVPLADGLNFVNGTSTVATVGANGEVKYDLNDDTKNKIDNAMSSFNIKANDEATSETISNGNTITFKQGDNIEVTRDGKNITIATSKTPTFDSVTISNGGPVINGDGINMNNKKITNVAPGTDGKDAVNVDQLNKSISDNKTVLKDGNNTTVSGTGTKDDPYKVNVSDNLTLGKDGANGVDGSIGVNGKDGSSVAINGKDGSIGLTGPRGENGKDGASATISVKDGQPGVDGKDGETKTRIVYETKDPTDPSKTITEEVATLNDGLKFKGDDGKEVVKKLNETLDVVGGADKDKLTENNIGVINKDGKLTVQLAKDVNLTEDGSLTIGDTKVNNGGLTITNGPSVTKDGIKAGDKQITNVASGLGNTKLSDAAGDTLKNAVNVGDLKNATTNLVDRGFKITADQKDLGLDADGNLMAEDTVKLGETVSYTSENGTVVTTVKDNKIDFKVSDNLTLGKAGQDGVDGTIGVNGKDGSSVVIDGKDGSIGLTGPKGENGEPGKTVTIKGKDGAVGLDGQDGVSRIVYTDPNGKENELATMNDGLKFTGNNSDTLNKHKLNSIVNVVGERTDNTKTYTAAESAANNIIVEADGTDKLTVKLAKDLTNLNSISNGKMGDSETKITLGDKSVSFGGSQLTNVASGLGDTKLSDATGDTLKNAVNVGDLKNAITDSETTLTDKGLQFGANSGDTVTNKLGSEVEIVGKGNKADDNYSSENIKTKVSQDANGKTTVEVMLDKELNVDKVTVGKDGKDGVDGTIGVNGKDGSAVVINGKDGSIGLNGKDGANGLTIKGDKGADGLDGTNGADGKTRIVYETVNPDGTKNKEEVATLNDGLNFMGDIGANAAVKLNKKVDIVGGQTDNTKLSSGANIGVVSSQEGANGKLKIQLAKDLTDITSISNGDTKITLGKDDAGNKTVNIGGSQLTDVASGLGNSTLETAAGDTLKNAVNVGDLKNATTNLVDRGFKITADNKGLDADGNPITEDTVKLGETVTYTSENGTVVTTVSDNKIDFKVSDDLQLGAKNGADGKDGVDGKIGVNGKDGSSVVIDGKDGSIGANGSNGAGVAINGKDGSIGLTGPKGDDGTPGKTVTIKGKDSAVGLDGQDGVSRIVYTDPNGKENELATMNDGLKFTGNNSDTLNKHKLNSIVNVVGERTDNTKTYTAAESAANNIIVEADGTDKLTVKLAKDLTNLNSISNGKTGDFETKITLGDKKVDVGGSKITNVAPGTDGTDAVNLNQLNKLITDNKTQLVDGKNTTVSGKGTADDPYKVNVSDNLTLGAKDGADGTDGVDGTIGINGKDGSAVVINGKDGSIGLNGKDGSNALTIKGDKGADGLDGANGEDGKTRIIYETKDKDGNPIREEVATLNDGLKFAGDDSADPSKVISKKLNQQLDIVGGADKDKLTDKNIGVNNVEGKLKVQLAKDLTDITSISNGDTKITLGKDDAGNKTVNIGGSQLTEVKSGSSGTDADGNPEYNTDTNGANIGDVKNIANNAKDELTNKGLNFAANSGENVHKNLGETLTIKGTGEKVDEEYSSKNIKTKTNADGSLEIMLAKELEANKVTVGKDGKDGVDGEIGVNGKDGASVVLNGKDGSIGLTGPKGADGKDGASANISVKDGRPGVDGKDGETKTRIVYERQDPTDPTKTITEEVATLNDGLKFKGDDGTEVVKKLNETLDVVGGANKDNLTDNNIGVNNVNGKLKVQLAKDVNLTEDGSLTIGDTKVNNGGLTITNGPSITKDGIKAGDKQITNVASGLGNTALEDATGDTLKNAVNVGDLKNATTNLVDKGFKITADNKALADNATEDTVKLGETVSYTSENGTVVTTVKNNQIDFKVSKDLTLGKDGENGEDGSLTVNGKDGSVVAIDGKDNTITAAGKDGNGVIIDGKDGSITAIGKDGTGVVINGKDGSIGLTGPKGVDGKDGVSANISVKDGQPGVDGKDGETKTRIVYETKDANGNPITEEVATLNDGLKFKGDDGTEVVKKLNDTLDVVGGANKDNLTDKNIGVNNVDGKLKVQLAKDLTDITSISNGDTKITIGKDDAGNKTVNIGGSQLTDVASGSSGTDAAGKPVYENDTNGANIGDVKNIVKDSETTLTEKGLTFTDDTGTEVHRDLGTKLQIAGDSNITTTADPTNGKITVGLGNDINVGEKGADGKDGVDGTIGVNGKDGASVVLNGKDGSIGLTGPKGADGKDGASANISVKDGRPGVDGKDGETKTRIVYEPKNPDGTPKVDENGNPIKEEVATLNDGLKFTGNNETTLNKHKLNTTVKIVGERDDNKKSYTAAESAKNNIIVEADGNDKLTVKLAKNLDLTNTGSVKIGDTTVNNDGLTIVGGPSVTKDGINAGNKTISNVATGVAGTDAVNVDQLNKSIADNKTQLVDGKNTTVSGSGTKDDPYKVNLNDTVTLGKDGNQIKLDGATGTITAGNDPTKQVVIDGNNGTVKVGDKTTIENGKATFDKVKIDGNKGDITGLTNTTLNDSDFAKSGRAATEEQLKLVQDNINKNIDDVDKNLTNKGLNFAANSGEPTHKNLGETLTIKGSGDKSDDNYSSENIKTRIDKDGNVEIMMDKDLKADKITVGKDGKDGVDGTIGVNGKDGSSVVLNGKDGSIGLTGPKGADGKDGASANISVKDGRPGVDGKDGDSKTRIVYETKDPTDPSKTITEEVATLNDGLNFMGDTGENAAVKLNKKVDIVGGQTDKTKLSEGANIGVVSSQNGENGKLEIKLAKDLTGISSITLVGGKDKDGNDQKVTINVSKDGALDLGNKQITGVADGKISKDSTDAINGSQLYETRQEIGNVINQHANAINNNSKRISKLEGRVDSGLANSAAMATLEFQEIGINQAVVGAAIGTYRGNQAVAVGVMGAPTENVRVQAKVSVAPGTRDGGVDTMAGVGASWKFNLK